MDRFEGIKIFVRVVESGSFSAGRIAQLGDRAAGDQQTGRSARRTSRCPGLMRTSQSEPDRGRARLFTNLPCDLSAISRSSESRVGSGTASPSGVVRVSAAPGFSRRYVVPKLPSFRARYPKVVVEMLVFRVDEQSRRRRHRPRHSQWRPCRTLALWRARSASPPVVAVASAEYLERRGEPTRLGDLDRHDGVIFVSQRDRDPDPFASRAGVISYQAAASFRSNDGEEQRAAVLAGLGITQAPHWLFAADIRAGTVRRILRDCEPAFRISTGAVRPASRRQPSKVAVFVDFLAELLAETDD